MGCGCTLKTTPLDRNAETFQLSRAVPRGYPQAMSSSDADCPRAAVNGVTRLITGHQEFYWAVHIALYLGEVYRSEVATSLYIPTL